MCDLFLSPFFTNIYIYRERDRYNAKYLHTQTPILGMVGQAFQKGSWEGLLYLSRVEYINDFEQTRAAGRTEQRILDRICPEGASLEWKPEAEGDKLRIVATYVRLDETFTKKVDKFSAALKWLGSLKASHSKDADPVSYLQATVEFLETR